MVIRQARHSVKATRRLSWRLHILTRRRFVSLSLLYLSYVYVIRNSQDPSHVTRAVGISGRRLKLTGEL